MKLPTTVSDLRGASQLACDATLGVTDLVEQMHGTILRLPMPLGPMRVAPNAGLARLVYGSIRGTTRLVDRIIDTVTRPLMGDGTLADDAPERQAVLAVLNGIMGDHLERTGNPLATSMQLRLTDQAVDLSAPAGKDQPRRWLLLAHGLCMNDRQWHRDGHDHGAALARDLGLIPLYLRYNSGLGVHENGALLSRQLEHFMALHGKASDEIHVLAYSLGGLVTRSALASAQEESHRWVDQLHKLIFLGTPHEGAPLAVGGHGIDKALELSPYSAAFAGLARARSQGLHDLRSGLGPKLHGGAVQLPRNTGVYSIAGALAGSPGRVGDGLLGDGLVPVTSALAFKPPANQEHTLPVKRQKVARSVGHLDLLSSPAVYKQLLNWMR